MRFLRFGSKIEIPGLPIVPAAKIIEHYGVGDLHVRYSFNESIPVDLVGLVLKPGTGHKLQDALDWPKIPLQGYQKLKNAGLPFCIYEPTTGFVTEEIIPRRYLFSPEHVYFATGEKNYNKMNQIIKLACEELNSTADGILELKKHSSGIDQQIYGYEGSTGLLSFAPIDISY